MATTLKILRILTKLLECMSIVDGCMCVQNLISLIQTFKDFWHKCSNIRANIATK